MEKTNRKRSKKNKNSWFLFLEALTGLGCQYELVEGTKLIRFVYEDKKFRAYCDYESEIDWDTISIFYFYHLFSYPEGFAEEYSWITGATNRSNASCNVTTYYNLYDDDDKDKGYLGSKAVLNYISRIPDLKLYLKKLLDEFSTAQAIVEDEMEKYREEKNALNMTEYFTQNNKEIPFN